MANSAQQDTPALRDLTDVGFFYSDSMLQYETNKKTQDVLAGYLTVKHEVIDANGKHRLLLELMPINGEIASIEMSSGELGNAKKIEADLNSQGLIVYNARLLREYILTSLRQVQSEQTKAKQEITRIGWSPDAPIFNTGRSLLMAQSESSAAYHHRRANKAYMAQSGTLKQWQRQVFEPAAANPLVLGAMCIALSSLLYDKLNLPMGIVNYHGLAGTGKTLLLQVAGSQFGYSAAPDQVSPNALHPGYIRKFNCTASGFEVMAAEYTSIALLLDELGETDLSMLGQLIYTLSSGQGKNRATSNLQTAQNIQWQTAMISVGEISMQQAIASSKQKPMNGQLDRCADVAIASTPGIFTEYGKFGSFAKLTSHLKQTTGQYYGTAAVAFIQWLLDHPEKLDQLADDFNNIIQNFAPDGCQEGSLRVMHRFAAAIIAGHLAVESGIYTCSLVDIENAMHLTINTWWQDREWPLKQIAAFVIENQDKLKVGRVTREQVPGFWDEQEGWLAIPSATFETCFGDNGRELLAALNQRGLLVIEQKARLKKRFCNNSVFAYTIKIEPIINMIKLMTQD